MKRSKTLKLILFTLLWALPNLVFLPSAKAAIYKNNFTRHERPVAETTSTANSPYIGTNSAGRYYDKATGQLVSTDTANDVRRGYGNPASGGVRVWKHKSELNSRENGLEGYSLYEENRSFVSIFEELSFVISIIELTRKIFFVIYEVHLHSSSRN